MVIVIVEEGFMVEETVEEARLLLRRGMLWTVAAVVGEADGVLLWEGDEGVVVDVVGVEESWFVTCRAPSDAEEGATAMDDWSTVVSVVVVIAAPVAASESMNEPTNIPVSAESELGRWDGWECTANACVGPLGARARQQL